MRYETLKILMNRSSTTTEDSKLTQTNWAHFGVEISKYIDLKSNQPAFKAPFQSGNRLQKENNFQNPHIAD